LGILEFVERPIRCRREADTFRESAQRNWIERVSQLDLIAQQPHAGERNSTGCEAKKVGNFSTWRQPRARWCTADQDQETHQNCGYKMQRFEAVGDSARRSRQNRPTRNHWRSG